MRRQLRMCSSFSVKRCPDHPKTLRRSGGATRSSCVHAVLMCPTDSPLDTAASNRGTPAAAFTSVFATSRAAVSARWPAARAPRPTTTTSAVRRPCDRLEQEASSRRRVRAGLDPDDPVASEVVVEVVDGAVHSGASLGASRRSEAKTGFAIASSPSRIRSAGSTHRVVVETTRIGEVSRGETRGGSRSRSSC